MFKKRSERAPNARLILENFCKATPEAEWPQLLRAYGGVDQLMAAVVDWASKKAAPAEPSDDVHTQD